MPSPDTSAQNAPVASQEAEARESVVRAGWSFGGPNRGPNGRDARTAINDALNAYAAAIRASERGRYAALVEGVRALHNGHGGAYGGVFCYSACHALAALEEAMG